MGGGGVAVTTMTKTTTTKITISLRSSQRVLTSLTGSMKVLLFLRDIASLHISPPHSHW
jgi:hypothetical protein